jgi:RNA polymerase sigma-70 factor (ECF subfamily)
VNRAAGRVHPAVDELTRLLLDAQQGDRLALGAAIRLSQPDVWRLAAYLVGPAHADDVTQDVYVKMFRSLDGFRGDSSGRTWLLAITRHTCLDARRRHRRRRIFVPLTDEHADAAVAPAVDAAIGFQGLLAGLSDERRLTFVLTQVLGCTYEETARICRVPIGTVRSRMARAREDLVEALRASNAI